MCRARKGNKEPTSGPNIAATAVGVKRKFLIITSSVVVAVVFVAVIVALSAWLALRNMSTGALIGLIYIAR